MPTVLSVRIDDDLDAQLDELCRITGLSRSEAVRNALQAGVAEGLLHAGRLQNPLVRHLVRALVAADGDPEQMELFQRVLESAAVAKDGTR